MNIVERFYDRSVQREWERLDRHRTEFALTLRALEDYLPRPPAIILDVGGGPGRYSIELARRGYTVTLADLSRVELEFARGKAQELGVEIAGLVQANALALVQFDDESFDAVLLMGPLYHLLERSEREQAVREARRVLRHGGTIFASFITRYAPFRDIAKNRPGWLVSQRERCEQILSSGILRFPPEEDDFVDAYFALPTEVQPLLEQGGFESLSLLACEGVISMIEDKVNALSGEAWDAWVELNYQLGKDPSVHGAAEHLLYIGRKR